MIHFRFLKSFLAFVVLIFVSGGAIAQKITSVQNGNWFLSSTWDCTPPCFPSTTDSVVIKHNVSMSLDWGLEAGGSIAVDTTGIFTEVSAGRTFVMNGGKFTNNGAVNFSNFAQAAGLMVNNDSMRLSRNVLITGVNTRFINNGSVNECDTVWIDAVFDNAKLKSEITGQSLYITDSLYNVGGMGFLEMWNDAGIMLNYGIIANNLFFNDGFYRNNAGASLSSMDLWNADDFYNLLGGKVNVGRDFANGDSVGSVGNPTVYNDGFFGIGNDYWNFVSATVTGTNGQICIGGDSWNIGPATGTIDVCDSTGSPFDDNGLSLGGGVTNCVGSCSMVVVVDDNQPACSGGLDGSITLTPFGGSGSYTYEWTTEETTASINSLGEGAYVCEVSDGFDTTYVLINLNTPVIKPDPSSVPAHCGMANGRASVQPTDGEPPYSFLWNDPSGQTTSTATGLNSGTYNVTITDDTGCVVTEFVIVPLTPMLASTQNITPPSCPSTGNGGIDITASGGKQPYTYAWILNVSTGPNANGLSEGSYSITIVDADSCVIVVNETLTALGGTDCDTVDTGDWKIYNGFTPNGDGLDDFWQIRGLGHYDAVRVELFTNRGIVVWDSDDYNNDWDGTDYSGNQLIDGVYYYVVYRPDEVDKGWVHLVR